MTAAADLQSYLQARRARIEDALERYLPAAPACPAIIGEATRYSVFAGGKRLRPILALAAAEAVADADPAASGVGALELALPAACAVEMIHTYSLIHDDLPAMDNDTLRRGRPTSHVVYGEGIAILAGDALLTEAFRLMAREPAADRLADPAARAALDRRKLVAIGVVAEAAGALGMVGGQALDLLALPGPQEAPPGSGRTRNDPDAVREIHARKTGALIRAAATAGAIMAGGADRRVGAIDAFAADLGLAFQIVDDILDVEGAEAELGKTAGKDAAADKPTYPALYGVAESRRLAAACIERALATLAAAGLGGRLPAIARWIVDRTH